MPTSDHDFLVAQSVARTPPISDRTRLWVLTIAAWILVSNASAWSQQVFRDAPNEEQLDMMAEATKITAFQINRFHQRLIEQCMPLLPKEVELQYLGVVSTNNGRKKTIIKDDFGLPLSWAFQDDIVVFSLWISTAPTHATTARCRLDDSTLYVNVDGIDQNRGVDDKLPELGFRSVRQILSSLEAAQKAQP